MRFLLAVFLFSTCAMASEFEISLDKTTKNLKTAEKGKLVIEIRPEAKLKISVEAPAQLNLKSCDNVQFAKTSFSKSDASQNTEKLLAFSIEITGGKVGTCKVEGTLFFYLCSKEWCKKTETKIETSVSVKASK